MGFLNGLLDCIATSFNQTANKYDKMSDQEIESKYGEPASIKRNSAQAAHDFYDLVQNRQENDDR